MQSLNHWTAREVPKYIVKINFTCFFFFLLKFLFRLGVWLINKVVIVSGVRWRDSALYIHVSIAPQPQIPLFLPSAVQLLDELKWHVAPFAWLWHSVIIRTPVPQPQDFLIYPVISPLSSYSRFCSNQDSAAALSSLWLLHPWLGRSGKISTLLTDPNISIHFVAV